MPRVCLVCDLDGSLFQTLRGGGGPRDASLVPAALARDGRALSFMTGRQAAFFGLLGTAGIAVPATARNLESFGRVRLGFRHGAVLDFGGIVTGPGGEADREWLAALDPAVREAAPLLERALELAAGLARGNGLDAVPRLVGDLGRVYYMCVKSPSRDLGGLALLRDLLEGALGDGARLHLNGNNLAVLPPFLDKAPAVEHYLARHLPWPREETLVLGLGDSLSDLGFLGLCDYGVFPGGSQLAEALRPVRAAAPGAPGRVPAGGGPGAGSGLRPGGRRAGAR
ncbi:MAG: hypothetical protein LBG06_09390 [Deltaproteobacteria bacterium]|jgi:hypothetical protein|nr:hypothetical protein [Deltaproteobacteria bacterium]